MTYGYKVILRAPCRCRLHPGYKVILGGGLGIGDEDVDWTKVIRLLKLGGVHLEGFFRLKSYLRACCAFWVQLRLQRYFRGYNVVVLKRKITGFMKTLLT